MFSSPGKVTRFATDEKVGIRVGQGKRKKVHNFVPQNRRRSGPVAEVKQTIEDLTLSKRQTSTKVHGSKSRGQNHVGKQKRSN